MSDDLTARLALLRAPFPPEQIGKLPKRSKREDGSWGPPVYLEYVGHADVTDRLLSVDPTWSWQPFATDENGLPCIVGGNLWIRLTVCGVTRIGVGDGNSIKECIGDAIRNAAMRFGVALDLWAKGDRDYVNAYQREHAERPQHVANVYDAIASLPNEAKAALREWYNNQGFPPPNELDEQQAADVVSEIQRMQTEWPTVARPGGHA